MLITVTKSETNNTYVLDVDGAFMTFESFEAALEFLLDYGIDESDAQILLK